MRIRDKVRCKWAMKCGNEVLCGYPGMDDVDAECTGEEKCNQFAIV